MKSKFDKSRIFVLRNRIQRSF